MLTQTALVYFPVWIFSSHELETVAQRWPVSDCHYVSGDSVRDFV